MNLVTLPTIPPATQAAHQAEENLRNLLTQLANELTASLRACWESESPQAFIDAYGTNAGKVFSLHGDLVALFVKHAEILPATVPQNVLELVGSYTVNGNGTVTVQ